MIDHRFVAEYLNPQLWNNLNEVLAPIYYRDGKTLHLYENKNNDILTTVTGEVCCNSKIEPTCGYDRVIRYSMEGIINFYRKIEEMDFLSKSIDEYQIQINNELNKTKGIDIIGKERRSSFFQLLRSALPKDDSIFLLWIKDEKEQPFFNCILHIKNDQIVLVSTSDRYEPEPVTFDSCVQKAEKEFRNLIIAKEYTYKEWCAYVAEKII